MRGGEIRKHSILYKGEGVMLKDQRTEIINKGRKKARRTLPIDAANRKGLILKPPKIKGADPFPKLNISKDGKGNDIIF